MAALAVAGSAAPLVLCGSARAASRCGARASESQIRTILGWRAAPAGDGLRPWPPRRWRVHLASAVEPDDPVTVVSLEASGVDEAVDRALAGETAARARVGTGHLARPRVGDIDAFA